MFFKIDVFLFAKRKIHETKFGYIPRVSPETVKEYMNKITNYDSSKARGTLSWNPIEINDSIRDTLNWIKHKLN